MKRIFTRVLCVIMTLVLLIALLPAASVWAYTVYRQNDSRWSSLQYGYSNSAGTVKATMGSSACGPFSFINATSYLTGNFIEPTTICSYSVRNGYRINGSGTAGGLFKSFANAYGANYGVKYITTDYSYSLSTLRSYLNQGYVVICNAPGHYICVAAYDSSTGKYLVLDSYPSSARLGSGVSSGWVTSSRLTSSGNKLYVTGNAFYVVGKANTEITSAPTIWTNDTISPEYNFDISWSEVANAKYYKYKVIQLVGEPDSSNDNEAANATILAENTWTSSRSLTIPASSIADGRWIKVAVCAVGTAKTLWSSKYVQVTYRRPSAPTLNLSYYQTVPANTDLKISWNNCANTTNYTCKVVLLGGEPNPMNSNESGDATSVMLTELYEITSTSVTIPAAKITGGKWIKIAVAAKNPLHTEWSIIYVRVLAAGEALPTLQNDGRIDFNNCNTNELNEGGCYIFNTEFNNAFNGFWWLAVTATYSSTYNGYIVSGVYPTDGEKSVVVPRNGIMLGIHNYTVTAPDSAKLKIGSLIKLSSDGRSYATLSTLLFDKDKELDDWVVKPNTGVTIDSTNKRVSGISEEKTVQTIKSMFDNDIKIFNIVNMELADNAKVGTGCYIKRYTSGGKVSDSVQVVISGDCDGDGTVTVTDYLSVKRHFQSAITLENAYFEAADIDGDGRISTTDYLNIRRYITKVIDLYK